MDYKPKISICVPVYNSAQYLDKCLISLTGQTYKNLEIVLVIDGDMEDNSVEICNSWKKKDERIIVVQQEHGGLSIARNTGLDNASGEFIGIVDPDDYVEAEMYEKLFEGIISNGCDLCIEGYIEQKEGEEDGEKKECFDMIVSAYDAVGMMINDEIGAFPWNKLYSRKLFNNLRYPEHNSYYDVGTTYKLIEKANRVCMIPFAGYHYIKRKNSITGRRRISDYLEAIEMHISRYDDLVLRRPDLIEGLCKDMYDSCVSLAAAGFVSGKKSRDKNKERRKTNNNKIQKIKLDNKMHYTIVKRIVMSLCLSDSTLVLIFCLGLEQIRRWVKGK